LDSLINSVLDIYQTFAVSKRIPIQNFAQVAKLLIYFVALIGIVSLVLGESPLKLFAGLGAMTAVLMLVFKDPILGFVAGLQLSYNKMVNIGDWVEIPQHNADGDILEIGLTTVKVQNFDNTITTVPTQSLINESFKNWRGMQESAGRRIKRAIYIDVNSIKFCDEMTLARYTKVDYIEDYIKSKKNEVEEYNKKNVANPESVINGRRLTNIGTFRAYILAYLKNHPNINQNLTVLVRQLAPTDSGLPLEIYTFSSEKNWIKYEAIQADIFDHLFAVAKEFDLDVFQKPSGADFKNCIILVNPANPAEPHALVLRSVDSCSCAFTACLSSMLINASDIFFRVLKACSEGIPQFKRPSIEADVPVSNNLLLCTLCNRQGADVGSTTIILISL